MTADSHTPDGTFAVQVEKNGGEIKIAPAGELDLGTAPELEARLAAATADGCKALVLDLQRLTFIDSSGVRLVAAWAKRARGDGLDFHLVRGTAHVHRVFELTGLAKTLPFD
jgi:anti-anti-sigma factor